MADLLLELFSEEIPARMQKQAAEDLRKLVTDALVAGGFLYEGARTFVTPRRLTLAVHGLPRRGQDLREEKRGPRVGAPQAAIDGFLKSAGLASLDEAKVVSDPKKGDSYVAVIERPGRATADVLAEIIPAVVKSFPWPKSMRWGAASASGASFRWVRPLRSILCMLGDEHEEPEVVSFEVGGIRSSNVTYGHRFLSDGKPIVVKRLDDYLAKLEAAKVIADPERRKDAILHEARQLCFAQGLELVEDEGLAAEVAGLVEWPVPLMGSFEEEFLEVPPEVVRLTIRANQKCFVVRDPGTGGLANRFIATANTEAADGGETIIAGNARVIRARLSDARFFWQTDRKVKLIERLEKLKTVRFHEKLGTQWERVERIAALAREIAPQVGADPALAKKAARLAKADLATEMVGEFPELQGLMGRYYAALEGHEPEVAAAIEEHYKPLGPSDRVPTAPVSIAVALADKLDTLVGFWAIDEKPTGSKDPYALRRAALGVIRLVVENRAGLGLLQIIAEPIDQAWGYQVTEQTFEPYDPAIQALHSSMRELDAEDLTSRVADNIPYYWDEESIKEREQIQVSLLAFFHDRLKVMLREQGARHDLVDAVLGAGAKPSPLVGEGREGAADAGRVAWESGTSAAARSQPSQFGPADPLPALPHEGGGREAANDDLLSIVNRVNALSALLATEDGANLLAGYKRAANILRAEEKKDGEGAFDGKPDAALLAEPEEKALAEVLDAVERQVARHLAEDDYEGAMQRMAELRPAVDAFFDRILVNAPDPALRANRLRLLAGLRRVTAQVADFGKVGG